MKNPLVEWTTAPLLEQNAHKSYIPVIVPSSHPSHPPPGSAFEVREERPHGPAQRCGCWKSPHTFWVQSRACPRCDGALSTAEYSFMQTGHDRCSPHLPFKLGGPVLGDRSDMVNPCSILTLRPMSPSQNHVLMNVRWDGFLSSTWQLL